MEDDQQQRESVRVDKYLMDKLRVIAKREGWLIGPFVDRLIMAGLKAEKIK